MNFVDGREFCPRMHGGNSDGRVFASWNKQPSLPPGRMRKDQSATKSGVWRCSCHSKGKLQKTTLSALSRALYLLLVLALPCGCFAQAQTSQPEQHRLRLYETHTQERIDIVYRLGDRYLPQAIARLNHFLRDHRTGQVHHFDPSLFDLLYDLAEKVGHRGKEIDVICGYRSPWSNAYLRKHTSGVAKNSLHMRGEAIDIRMPGVKLAKLREAALEMHRGGVGYYPASQFIHVDVGRPRWW
jgi:uncharacterized protein YcbK (DUF882 family)